MERSRFFVCPDLSEKHVASVSVQTDATTTVDASVQTSLGGKGDDEEGPCFFSFFETRETAPKRSTCLPSFFEEESTTKEGGEEPTTTKEGGDHAGRSVERTEDMARRRSVFADRFLSLQEKRHRRQPDENKDENKQTECRDESRKGKRRRYLVFDTETTGLRGSVIQLAFLVSTEEGEELYHRNWYLKTRERIEEGAKAVHGITEDVLREKGEDPTLVLSRFADVVAEERRRGTIFVAHNAAFDVARLSHTASVTGGKDPIRKGEVVCSMLAFKDICKATDRRGKRKNPRNEEVYSFLFHSPPPFPLHDAMGDVRVTMANWVEGAKRWGSL